MDWSMPMDQEDREVLAKLRQQFTACCAGIAANGRSAESVAAAVALHLAAMTSADLPPAAQPIWSNRVARPLKADATKPLAPRAVHSIRSWPSSRADELAVALAEIEAVLVDVENEALHEAIYVEISRAYS